MKKKKKRKNYAKDKQCCRRLDRSAEDRELISTGALGGVGLPRLGLGFGRKIEGQNSSLQVLQLETLGIGPGGQL